MILKINGDATLTLYQLFPPREHHKRTNFLWSQTSIVFALINTSLFFQVCRLRASSFEQDSVAKLFLDIIPYGTFSIVGVALGFYFLDKHLNPDRHLFEPKVSEWQKLIFKNGTIESRAVFISRLIRIAYQQKKRKHFIWFQILDSTNKYSSEKNAKKRHKKVMEDLARKNVKIENKTICARIVKTSRYSELETWLPRYIITAANEGDAFSKQLSCYFPIKTRFFLKKKGRSIFI